MQVKNKKSLFFTFFLIISTIFLAPTNKAVDNIAIFGTSGIAVDRDTGAIYCSKNIDQEVGLASVSKYFVIGYFLDHMAEKNLTLDTPITISQNVGTIKNRYNDASGLYLPIGEEVSVNKLIELALVFSDNGATVQLAEALSGTEAQFVTEINQSFIDQGYSHTKFVNASGLDDGDEKNPTGNVSTAREVARMTINVLDQHQDILNYTQETEVEFDGDTFKSFNEMLPGGVQEYPGIKGLKTGSSDLAGFNFLSYCEQEDKKTITFIADAKDAYGQRNRAARFTETAKMLNFSKGIELETIIGTDYRVKVDVKNNGLGTDNFFPKRNLAVVKGANTSLVFDSIIYNPQYFTNNSLTKSIPQGETVATLKVTPTSGSEDLSVYYKDGTIDVELINTGKTSKENIFFQLIYAIPRFFVGIFNYI